MRKRKNSFKQHENEKTRIKRTSLDRENTKTSSQSWGMNKNFATKNHENCLTFHENKNEITKWINEIYFNSSLWTLWIYGTLHFRWFSSSKPLSSLARLRNIFFSLAAERSLFSLYICCECMFYASRKSILSLLSLY